MNIKISSFVVLVCGTLPFVYSEGFFQVSVKSHIFEQLRPKHPPKSISECNAVVTEPYGLLEQTYKRGQVKEGASCSWTLHAPANHVVNVISVRVDLLDDIPTEKRSGGRTGSRIELFDGTVPSEFPQAQFSTDDGAHADNHFLQSMSSKQDMLVKINYHDSVGYATQKIAVKYEFLNVDDMYRLLRADNVKPKTTR